MLKTILICCLLVPPLQSSTFGMTVPFTDATAGCCDSSHTYQCLRCHCRRRNGGPSFPCRLRHRGQCHLAGVFELEEHNFSSKNKSLQSSLYLSVHTCVYVITVCCFPQSFHSCRDSEISMQMLLCEYMHHQYSIEDE